MSHNVDRWCEPGNRCLSPCPICEEWKESEYRSVDYEMTANGGRRIVVPDLPALVCLSCQSVTAIPHQSTGQIRAARDADLDALRRELQLRLELPESVPQSFVDGFIEDTDEDLLGERFGSTNMERVAVALEAALAEISATKGVTSRQALASLRREFGIRDRGCDTCGVGWMRLGSLRGRTLQYEGEERTLNTDVFASVCDHCGDYSLNEGEAQELDHGLRRQYDRQG